MVGLEALWKGSCSVIVRREKQNPVNKRVEFEEITIYENQPCKLSFKTIVHADENNNVTEVTQNAKLFLSNELNIPAGSKIVVTQNGKTNAYAKSGEPAIYTKHQEISLALFKGWA